MRFRICLVLAAAMVLSACAAGGDYKDYANAHAQAEAARYKVLSDVAATGGESAKVAAVMAMALGGQQSTLRAPEAAGGTALQWLGVLLPSAVQAFGINANMKLGMTQSDNAASVARSTNDTMTGIAKLIQAPGAITNNDRHDVYTPAPVIAPATPVIVTPPAPVVITPVVQIVPTVPK